MVLLKEKNNNDKTHLGRPRFEPRSDLQTGCEGPSCLFLYPLRYRSLARPTSHASVGIIDWVNTMSLDSKFPAVLLYWLPEILMKLLPLTSLTSPNDLWETSAVCSHEPPHMSSATIDPLTHIYGFYCRALVSEVKDYLKVLLLCGFISNNPSTVPLGCEVNGGSQWVFLRFSQSVSSKNSFYVIMRQNTITPSGFLSITSFPGCNLGGFSNLLHTWLRSCSWAGSMFGCVQLQLFQRSGLGLVHSLV